MEDPAKRDKLNDEAAPNDTYDHAAFNVDNELNCPITFMEFLPTDSTKYDGDAEKY